MIEVKDILRYISPNTSFVVNLDDYRRFIEIAKLEEQERIIALLEAEKFTIPPGFNEGTTYMPIQEAIALIKGEQK